MWEGKLGPPSYAGSAIPEMGTSPQIQKSCSEQDQRQGKRKTHVQRSKLLTPTKLNVFQILYRYQDHISLYPAACALVVAALHDS